MRIAALVLVIAVAAVPAANAAPQDVANDISANIMSPFCPGVTLHDCPSDSAVALRDRITEMAREGWTRDQIMTELEREYGPSIRAVPAASGGGLVAWLLPALALLAAGATAWLLLRRWVRTPAAATAPAARTDGLTGADRDRLETELAKLRGRP